ncbi:MULTISPECIES: general secretion pathway protein GspN [Pseudomonas]|uniref:General secretion pathway protein GspN n=2 Tax=Pseudomonas TaxID=286 RepID=A0A2R7UQC5_PSEDL|nr:MULTISPECIES: general secretion pathway protein GspN [Pseudomonas]MRF43260.1 general secretion pathway protein GspN [Escherichia coli]MBF8648530.1 general secretion pathway protein GspN [Pseudomonas pudica]MBF8705956.1 general secretion pathway protein GspN [Pseudomonas putida]MBF8762983.1 general secretion pathway protein GspN [Pseudomonas pudica]PTU53334.1 general secretion pathway protein GspN [Pseudomonas plecoglossicida]
MSRISGAWVMSVFAVTLLVELPASWVVRGIGLPAREVSGSLWQGQAQQLGPVGPLRWAVQPWRLQANAQLGFQGQAWQLRAEGWPWRWRLEATAMGAQATVATDYRLAGQWQGTLRMQGAGRQCRASEGRMTVTDLALSEPWSLGLGQGWLEMDCRSGWHLRGQLVQQGQHELAVDADLPARRAQVMVKLQPEAALTPLLRGVQWLGPQALAGQRDLRW